MVHGFPDWGEYAPQTQISKSLDVAELAVRLGSPCIYDRRGTVMFLDDFSSGLNKWKIIVQNNQQIYPTAKVAYLGGYSLAFYDDSSYIEEPRIYLILPIIQQSHLGIEVIFCFQDSTANERIGFQIFQNGIGYSFSFGYDRYNQIVQLKDISGNWQIIDENVKFEVGKNEWFVSKLVIDPVSKKFVWGRINSRIYNLNDYSAYQFSTSAMDALEPVVLLGSANNEIARGYVGYVIITQNE